ncbi:MAG: hypothetical protein L6243_03435 [Candidatus Altiarchaeales archaeon]|nr:hypothetical protein [Candidatus Altiarchaeota archaeon]MBU4266834.1 hypothetical protein [Candidatus Altiarchaeota archaeon]MBU4406795.1 hypothetical protein [Candidatus Altiarchaeota archaeon]MBU4436720.1 hypothetical protein [Candidatus Altiarchaeota archaeon]MCG2782622.1 hypothetical protein [Candidatus Altiarchaeales archaeon]
MTCDKKLDRELKELVLWRLEASVPEHFKLSVGGEEAFSKEELKMHVEQEDPIGLTFVNMQLDFIKALTSGKFSKVLAE